MKGLNKIRLKVLVLIICTLGFSGVAYGDRSDKASVTLEDRIDYLRTMIDYIEQYYVGDVTDEQMMDGVYKGLFESLDPHSSYFNPDEFKDFNMVTTGSFGGIGISVGITDGKVLIIETMEGSPGDRAGIKGGDIIVSVDHQDVTPYNLDKTVDLMRGEVGTKVTLGVKREGQDEILSFDITREIIKINPIEEELLDGNIGYVRIIQFNENTSENMDPILEEFQNKKVNGLILDLRDNPGGMLSEAINVADPLIPKGPVVYIDHKNKIRESYGSYREKIDIPLVVLVNGGSASASEIVAGAIQDTKSGILIGTQTYGKGTVQNVIPMDNGAGIKLTIARYLTPNGRSIDGIGITPDIILENPDNEDLQLKKAMEILRK